MSRIKFPNIARKAGLSADRSRLDTAAAAARSVLPQMIMMTPVSAGAEVSGTMPAETGATATHDEAGPEPLPSGSVFKSFGFKHLKRVPQLIRRHSIIAAALALLVFGGAAIRLGGDYWARTHIAKSAQTVKPARLPAKPIAGFNITVPAAELQNKLTTVTTQAVVLNVGTFSEPVSSDIIKSWLQITANKQKTEYYIHVNEAAMVSSLTKEANEYSRSPVNEVTVNEDGANVTVARGRNGRALSDTGTLKTQAAQTAKNVLDSKGLQFSTPLADVPFQSVTPAAFDKLLVANVTTKKMWAFQNGQQINSFLISAGAPATPTPLGQFHVYAKLTVQDMRGTNPNGTPYFQPKVPWVSYFYSGSAVHGVYWHPLSWFGVNNSSHGCVGLPVDQAKWVFDWAPIGTTVITHA